MRVLVIDHRDSFTYNLVSYIEDIIGARPVVVSYDADYDIADVEKFDAIVLSPGPGRVDNPSDIGKTLDVIRDTTVPILGVCLGHQAINYAWGGGTTRAPEPVHGRTSLVEHDGTGLFSGIENPVTVVRYHSLIADPIAEDIEITARSTDGITMAIAHASKPQWGVQFHPESIGGFDGHRLLENFLRLAARHTGLDFVTNAAGAGDELAEDLTDDKPGSSESCRWKVEARTLDFAVDAAAAFHHLYRETASTFWFDAGDKNHPDGQVSYFGDNAGPHSGGEHIDGIDGGALYIAEKELFSADTRDVDHLDLDFTLGWVGFVSYEVKSICGHSASAEQHYPTTSFIFTDRVIAVDHRRNKTHILFLLETESGQEDGTEPQPARDTAANAAQYQWAQAMSEQLHSLQPVTIPADPITVGPLTARHNREEYLAKIAACQEYIRAGDSYEICLTNQLSADVVSCDPLGTYLKFRALNPAPFGAFLNFGDQIILSSSPERFIKVTPERIIESRPIKGTRKRSEDPVVDNQLKADLETNPKDRSENLMIVDLVRNDLARIARPGTVTVPAPFVVESFATVHQLVSTVTAELAPENTLADVFFATFPGGSMTGAPKYRSMDIIEELEDGPRGIYSGAVGYFSLNGAMDFSMVIRTIVIRDGLLEYGVGGAILALSDPEEEYQETITKAAPLLRLIGQDFPQ